MDYFLAIDDPTLSGLALDLQLVLVRLAAWEVNYFNLEIVVENKKFIKNKEDY